MGRIGYRAAYVDLRRVVRDEVDPLFAEKRLEIRGGSRDVGLDELMATGRTGVLIQERDI